MDIGSLFLLNMPGGACRDYPQTSSVTKTLENLHWRPLDQRRIDSRLVIMYKVTYDLVAIPASEYLIPNRRESKFIHPLAYKQIPTSTNSYRYSFFQELSYTGIPPQPALSCSRPWHSLVMLCARWCMCPPKSPYSVFIF